MNTQLKYTSALLVFSGLILIALHKLNNTIDPSFKLTHINAIVAGFTIASFVIHLWLTKANNESTKKFLQSFMASTFIKLFGSLFTIVIYAFTHPQQATGFIICFLINYLAYLVFEVVLLLKFFKK